MTKSHSRYSFPSIEKLEPVLELIRSKSDVQILTSLRSYAHKTTGHSKSDYLKSREKFCAFHIVLNERGLIAPAFRPFRRLYKNTDLSAEEQMLGRDIQVINLHYLYCQHHGRFEPIEVSFKNLLSSDNFDFELASIYAAKKWKAETYSKYSLMLDNVTQMELSTFRNQAVRDRVKSIRESTRQMKVKLHNHIASPRSRILAADINKRLDEYECIKYAEGSPILAARFYKLKTGVNPSTNDKNSSEYMRKRKKWFETKMNTASW